jgi:hypothetical protein
MRLARLHARLAALEALSPNRVRERARTIVAALREMDRRCGVSDDADLDTLESRLVARLLVEEA